MHNALSTTTADVAQTLNIDPMVPLTETPHKHQVIHEFDDGSVAVACLSNTTYYDMVVNYSMISETDSATILDIWTDTAKANGSENTINFVHPVDGYTYVVRFMDVITRKRVTPNGAYVAVENVKFRVEGYVAP